MGLEYVRFVIAAQRSQFAGPDRFNARPPKPGVSPAPNPLCDLAQGDLRSPVGLVGLDVNCETAGACRRRSTTCEWREFQGQKAHIRRPPVEASVSRKARELLGPKLLPHSSRDCTCEARDSASARAFRPCSPIPLERRSSLCSLQMGGGAEVKRSKKLHLWWAERFAGGAAPVRVRHAARDGQRAGVPDLVAREVELLQLPVLVHHALERGAREGREPVGAQVERPERRVAQQPVRDERVQVGVDHAVLAEGRARQGEGVTVTSGR